LALNKLLRALVCWPARPLRRRATCREERWIPTWTEPLCGGKDCELAHLPTASTTYASPLRGPGPARPRPWTKAIHSANLRLGHRAPSRGGWRARTVSGCLNSGFLGFF